MRFGKDPRPNDSIGPIPTSSADDKDTEPHLFEGPSVPEGSSCSHEADTAPRCFYCGRTTVEYDTARDVNWAFERGIVYAMRRAEQFLLENGFPADQASALAKRMLLYAQARPVTALSWPRPDLAPPVPSK